MNLNYIKKTIRFSFLLIGFSLNAENNLTSTDMGEALFDYSWHQRYAIFEAKSTATANRLSAVDTTSRISVVSFYQTQYLPNLSVAIGWTGNASSCQAGNTSQAYLNATFTMINYFRGMVNLEEVVNDASLNAASQQAALMMSVNNNLSHTPPTNWICYTQDGAQAAGNSNLALGVSGPNSMVLYINDPGSNNQPVGHRRWILNPRAASFGVGSVGGSTRSANALWVFGGNTSRPTTDIVAWPPEGFVPNTVVYNRWSFSLNTSPSANYGSASVSMTENGSPISLNVVSRTDNGFGDNTIIWQPSGLSFPSGQADRTINVTVSGIGNASQSSYSYQVIVINPEFLSDVIYADGFE
ncbi:MAG: CAP domain-containing protein [Alcanivoracaceae bacterium]|nr:CAP domain-containing protein [Alcanivoracaceae bacterium]